MRDINWWQKLIVFAIFAAILLYAFKWSSEPEQFWAGDPDYGNLVEMDNAHQLFKVKK